MGRKRKGRNINGIVLLDKPLGGSSNQILQKVRWLFQAAKAGHTGALDPLASGMLPICLGEATKFSQFLLDADKEYEVTAELGKRTTTSDADGEVVATHEVTCSEQDVIKACHSFIGKSKQIPSMYSALKHQGKPLYFYARQGIEIEREARDITIFELHINAIELPFVTMRVRCSKGTYIRSLVDDIGQMLGCGAYVTRLHRTQVADYPNTKMVSLEHLVELHERRDDNTDFSVLDALLLPMDTAVDKLPLVRVDEQQTHRFQHGQSITAQVDKVSPENLASPIAQGEYYRVYGIIDGQPAFLGVGEGVLEPIDQPHDKRQGKVFVVPRRGVVYH